MKQKKNNSEVKKLNRNRVFRYINSKDKTTMPDIAAELDMSVPTVLQIVKELKEAGVVCDAGEFKSNGGRKPRALASVRDFRCAVGIDITRNHVSFILTDLKETVLKHNRIRKTFVIEKEYFRQIGQLYGEFVGEDEELKNKIAGVGISVPAIVDGTENRITYSGALEFNDVAGEVFSEFISCPCVLINDASAAAVTECIAGQPPEGMVYLALSNTVGGAIMFRSNPDEEENQYSSIFEKMYAGRHWHSGEFGHMVIHPKGRTCYCGKVGCVDAYCSALRLSEHTDGNLKEFFKRLEAGEPEFQMIWETYLDDLAIAVDNLRMCFDCDVVLGGYVGSLIGPYIEQVRKRVKMVNIFDGGGTYVRECKYRQEASALGAAIYFIEDFIDSI